MMSEPPAIHARSDEGARLLRRTSERRAVAGADLRLPRDLRLNERDRLAARTLIEQMVRAVDDQLRAAIADRFAAHPAVHAALASAQVDLAAPILLGSAALADADLIGLVLRRGEEHRFYLAARGANDRLQTLVGEPDGEIAAGAMSVLTARSRRLDRFGEPVLARTELPADLQHRLVWTVAAALRSYLVDRQEIEPAFADRVLGDAASSLLAGYDEADSLEARSTMLTHALQAAGRLDGSTLVDFLAQGTLSLFLAALSARTGIAYSAVWDILGDPDLRGPAMLLRAAGLDRQQAAQVVLLLSPKASDDVLIEQIETFDMLGIEEAGDQLRLWLIDPSYRDAVRRLSGVGSEA